MIRNRSNSSDNTRRMFFFLIPLCLQAFLLVLGCIRDHEDRDEAVLDSHSHFMQVVSHAVTLAALILTCNIRPVLSTTISTAMPTWSRDNVYCNV